MRRQNHLFSLVWLQDLQLPVVKDPERSVCLGYRVSSCTTRRRDVQWTKGLSSDVRDKGLMGNDRVTMAFYGPWGRVGMQSARSSVWGDCAFEYDSIGQDQWN